MWHIRWSYLHIKRIQISRLKWDTQEPQKFFQIRWFSSNQIFHFIYPLTNLLTSRSIFTIFINFYTLLLLSLWIYSLCAYIIINTSTSRRIFYIALVEYWLHNKWNYFLYMIKDPYISDKRSVYIIKINILRILHGGAKIWSRRLGLRNV